MCGGQPASPEPAGTAAAHACPDHGGSRPSCPNRPAYVAPCATTRAHAKRGVANRAGLFAWCVTEDDACADGDPGIAAAFPAFPLCRGLSPTR
ncbi:hypothetical protein DIE21_33895 [Burkholderia sp. Bp9140]|nr:hypothetical protein DIE21_33895 [Burkholderia sp. Bp9140]